MKITTFHVAQPDPASRHRIQQKLWMEYASHPQIIAIFDLKYCDTLCDTDYILLVVSVVNVRIAISCAIENKLQQAASVKM